MFDAYTVKKVLPRLVVAVILIQLSWFIFTGMITLTTAVAYGVQGLIYAPFGPPENFELDTLLLGASTSDGIVTGGTGVFVALALAGGTTLGILGGALTLALGALLAILIGFALLMFRQVLVVALLLVSPLALVAWILPNTEKFWKIWWESFSKLLLVFPMIVAVVAVGRVFAYITAGVNPGDSADNLLETVGIDELITIIFVVIGFFGPFFMIPKLFALAGGAFTFISGSVNDRSRGAFDRLKKSRQQTQAKNFGDLKVGDRYSKNNLLARGVNRAGANLGAGWSGRFGVGERGAAARTKNSRDAAARNAKEDQSTRNLILADDDAGAVLALSGGTTGGAQQAAADLEAGWIASGVGRGEARRRRDSALAAVMANGVDRQKAGAAMEQVMANKARAVAGGQAGIDQVSRGLDRLHGTNSYARAEAGQAAAYHARQGGRSDLGSVSDVHDGLRRTGAQAAVRGYTPGLTAQLDDVTARHHAAVASGNQDAIIETSSEIAALRNAMGQDVSEENKEELYKFFNNVGIDLGDARSVDQQLGDNHHQAAGAPSGDDLTQRIRDRAGLYDQGVLPPGQQPNSDVRLKRNVKYLQTINDIKLYRFQYLWSSQEYVGVMAQDLTTTHPEALAKDTFGYYTVDYSKLGLSMMTWEEWQTQEHAAPEHSHTIDI